MRTIKEKRNVRDYDINSFGQFITNIDNLEFTTHYGTAAEMVEESHKDAGVYVRRGESTEAFFPSWDKGSKYAVIWKGKAIQYAFRRTEIDGGGWRIPLFEIEE